MCVHLVGTLLTRQMPAFGKFDGTQVRCDVGPDAGDVVGFADPLEVRSPQGQHRAGEVGVPVLGVLGDILLAGAVIVAGTITAPACW